MGRKRIPIESFFGDNVLDMPFRIYKMEKRQTPSPLDPHRHDFYEIFFFEEGTGEHYIDFERFPVSPRSLHFVSPGQVHWLKRSLDSHGWLVAFSRSFFSKAGGIDTVLNALPFFHPELSPSLTLNESTFSVLQEICGKLIEEAKMGKDANEEIIRSYFKILLIECTRFLDRSRSELQNNSVPGYYREFLQFRKAVENSFSFRHRVKDYTSELGLSHQKLNEIVKKATGKTALEFIHDRQLLEAKRLLIFSDNNIKEVAYALEFYDPSNFSKFFKAKTGISPLEFKLKS